MKLRDRDAIITKEGVIFRVYGYLHPPEAYICDPEYGSPIIFRSTNFRAKRGVENPVYYKFFADEGLKLILNKFPKFAIFYEPLQKCLVGVNKKDIIEVRKPNFMLKELLAKQVDDVLLSALHDLLNRILSNSSLMKKDFGIFGSLLFGFYHPSFSDLDFIIYGKEKLNILCETLSTLYKQDDSLSNEFDKMESVRSKNWKFLNYSLEEYVWHQKRKMVYAYFDYKDAGRIIKAEFEPVRTWKENIDVFNNFIRISHIGWIKAIVEIIDDKEAAFLPSIYEIKVKNILKGPKLFNIKRIISYMEEFRMQIKKGEVAIVEGNLEKIIDGTNRYHQITLSYGPRYYEQVFKIIKTF